MIFPLMTWAAVTLDIFAWLVIHLGVAYAMSRRNPDSFSPFSWLYRQRSWENGGQLYTRVFRVKSWKKSLPDGAAIFKNGFQKKRLREKGQEYLMAFTRETCRAELTHWIAFLCGFIFFLWNLWWVGIIMVVYAAAVNLPCIIAQRYNRIRLRRIIGSASVLPTD